MVFAFILLHSCFVSMTKRGAEPINRLFGIPIHSGLIRNPFLCFIFKIKVKMLERLVTLLLVAQKAKNGKRKNVCCSLPQLFFLD